MRLKAAEPLLRPKFLHWGWSAPDKRDLGLYTLLGTVSHAGAMPAWASALGSPPEDQCAGRPQRVALSKFGGFNLGFCSRV